MEWLDELENDGVLHALDMFGVSDETKEAVEESGRRERMAALNHSRCHKVFIWRGCVYIQMGQIATLLPESPLGGDSRKIPSPCAQPT